MVKGIYISDKYVLHDNKEIQKSTYTKPQTLCKLEAPAKQELLKILKHPSKMR